MWVNGEKVECWPQNISALNYFNLVDENNVSNIRMSLACVKRLKYVEFNILICLFKL